MAWGGGKWGAFGERRKEMKTKTKEILYVFKTIFKSYFLYDLTFRQSTKDFTQQLNSMKRFHFFCDMFVIDIILQQQQLQQQWTLLLLQKITKLDRKKEYFCSDCKKKNIFDGKAQKIKRKGETTNPGEPAHRI
jgi:hypothetical protein